METKRRILHIEDSLDDQDRVHHACVSIPGFEIELISCNSGRSGIALFRNAHEQRKRFDLVIVDGNLMDMEGNQVIAMLRSNPGTLPPVIAYVGDNLITPEDWSVVGVTEVILKPAIGTLAATITRLLESAPPAHS